MEVFTSDQPVFAPDAVQRILDAAARLQVQRSAVASAVETGSPPGVELVGGGLRGINAWIREQTPRWRELWSVRLTTTAGMLRVSLPQNRVFVAGGARMVSLFDYYRTEPMARLLLGAEDRGDYLFCYAPIQVKIVDRRRVLLEGPVRDGEPTLMAVSDPGCLAAATAYWRNLLDSAIPCRESGGDLDELTPRQRQVVALLAADSSDEQIAKTLGVSVRTVRYDIAHLLERLEARSRFAAGLRLGALGGASGD